MVSSEGKTLAVIGPHAPSGAVGLRNRTSTYDTDAKHRATPACVLGWLPLSPRRCRWGK